MRPPLLGAVFEVTVSEYEFMLKFHTHNNNTSKLPIFFKTFIPPCNSRSLS